MPTDGDAIGINTRWFAEALAGASEQAVLGGTHLRIITPVAFLATKLTAFFDRGNGDYHGSRDIEDFLTVIDGRTAIVAEISAVSPAMRDYIRTALWGLLAHGAFRESLSAALPSDAVSQARLPLLRRKLQAIADSD